MISCCGRKMKVEELTNEISESTENKIYGYDLMTGSNWSYYI